MASVRLPSAGDNFLGTWLIEGEVGKGGFSVVYRARDSAGRIAAVKVLLPQGEANISAPSYDGDLAERFLREARLLTSLDSPYTIRLWDYGESPDGLLYMIFEFIDGRMLFDEIKNTGALAEERVIHVMRQTLIALESAHALGILHRDIKPNNIMIFERDGDPDRVKLVDFGIAKMFGEAEAMPGNDLTAAGLLVGTPRYMSPEQLKGDSLAPASDLYSVGLCAIEMLSGRKCIPGKDRIKIVELQLRPEPIRIPDDIPVEPRLAAIVHRLTEKDLSRRYKSATDAVRDLEALAGDPGATGDTVFQTVPSQLSIPARAPALPADVDTVMHRVSAADMNSLLAGQPVADVDPYDATMASATFPVVDDDNDRTMASSISNDALKAFAGGVPRQPPPPIGEAATKPFARPDQSYGSGEFNRLPSADQSFGSGEFHRPPASQSYGSGEFNRPPASQSYGSGEFNQPPVQQPSAGGGLVDKLELESLTPDDKIALFSCVVPGVGQVIAGQTAKGAIIMGVALIAMLFTFGLAWLILMPVFLADTFLLLRAQTRREVGPYELFADVRDLL